MTRIILAFLAGFCVVALILLTVSPALRDAINPPATIQLDVQP